MNESEVRSLLADLIAEIAPEAELATVPDDADIRDALDLDSIDFTNLMIALHARTGLDIPEADYQRLFTLGGAVRYITHRSGGIPLP
jgi:acyl carrier protein